MASSGNADRLSPASAHVSPQDAKVNEHEDPERGRGEAEEDREEVLKRKNLFDRRRIGDGQRCHRPRNYEEEEEQRLRVQQRLRASFLVRKMKGRHRKETSASAKAAPRTTVMSEDVDFDLFGDVRRRRRHDAISGEGKPDEETQENGCRNYNCSEKRREFEEAVAVRRVVVDVDGGGDRDDDDSDAPPEQVESGHRTFQLAPDRILPERSPDRLSPLLRHFLVDDVSADHQPEQGGEGQVVDGDSDGAADDLEQVTVIRFKL